MMRQAPSTESIMAALFLLAQSANTPATPFNIMSRRMRHFNDVSANEMPAFFQFQAPGFSTTEGVRGLPVKKRMVWWFVYLPGSPDLNTPCSPLMNAYYDALSNILLTNPAGNKQTLGGLVTNCYEEGKGLADEGLLSTQSLIGIPITYITGI